nr:hypothetical protein CFP56_21397 [Quercus suber]
MIPESPDSFVEDLVQRVNRGRFNFELGDASDGSRLSRAQAQNYVRNRARDNANQGQQQNQAEMGCLAEQIPTFLINQWAGSGPHSVHSVSNTRLESLTLTTTHSDPLPLTSTQRDDVEGTAFELVVHWIASKKRFRKEIGRLGRNIRQRLFCGFFQKVGDGDDQGDDEVRSNEGVQRQTLGILDPPKRIQMAKGKLVLNSFPSNHKDFQRKL